VCSEQREDRASSLKESAKATNFSELCHCEVLRKPFLGDTRVNRSKRKGWAMGKLTSNSRRE
jgi:hypothetical protein